MRICQSRPELPFAGGIPTCPQIGPNFAELVIFTMEISLMYGVAIDKLCGSMLAMAFQEKGMLAKMFHEEPENGGPVWERTELI